LLKTSRRIAPVIREAVEVEEVEVAVALEEATIMIDMKVSKEKVFKRTKTLGMIIDKITISFIDIITKVKIHGAIKKDIIIKILALKEEIEAVLKNLLLNLIKLEEVLIRILGFPLAEQS
jgi:hypothetical protein